MDKWKKSEYKMEKREKRRNSTVELRRTSRWKFCGIDIPNDIIQLEF